MVGYQSAIWTAVWNNGSWVTVHHDRNRSAEVSGHSETKLVPALSAAQTTRRIEREAFEYFLRWFMWTDLAVVLRYSADIPVRVQSLAASRVRKIHELRSIRMWCHIPIEINLADRSSRGSEWCSGIKLHMWLEGPTILSDPVGSWSMLPRSNTEIDDQMEFHKL